MKRVAWVGVMVVGALAACGGNVASSVPDGGGTTSPPTEDAGTTTRDATTVPGEAGRPPAVDSGPTTHVDSGSPSSDEAGPPSTPDSGPPPSDDAGVPVGSDAGEPGNDAGIPVGNDAGTPIGGDSGSAPPSDGGSPTSDDSGSDASSPVDAGADGLFAFDAGSPSFGDSGSDVPPAAYINAYVGQAPGGHSCDIDSPPDTPYFTLGSESTTGPQPVSNGGTFMGTEVSVACIVHATSAQKFQVTAQVTDGELAGFTLSGTLANTSGAQPNISVFASRSGTDSYSEHDCTFTLTSRVDPAIASGRVWGTASCPNFANTQDAVTCAATIEFQLTNCDQ